MTRNRLIYYNPELREKARRLRNESTFSEILLWLKIKGKTFGYEFHRQVPLDEYIVDFYCHELSLAIEIDGSSHDNKYDYDLKRQRRLESLGVRFIRFEDIDVKRNMNDVLRTLEFVISELEKEEGKR
jgi:very-short-patch-repair endonuclease